MLWHLTSTEVCAESIWGFTVAWVKSLPGADLRVIVVAVCGRTIKANHNLTNPAEVWQSLQKFARPYQVEIFLLCFRLAWGNLASGWTEPLNMMIRIEEPTIPNYTSIEWLPICYKLKNKHPKTWESLKWVWGLDTMAQSKFQPLLQPQKYIPSGTGYKCWVYRQYFFGHVVTDHEG